MSRISRVREPAFNTTETNSSGAPTSSYTRSYDKASRKEGSAILSWLNLIAGLGKQRRSLPFVVMTAEVVGESSNDSNTNCSGPARMIRPGILARG
jgi:hypothetical protein